MNREEYLAEVAAKLPLPEAQRAEVLEELAAHLGDGVADLGAHGRDPEAAEDEVVRRLGSPDELAQGLLRARQTTSQLLAAAGAGVFAALRSGIFGSIAGWLIVALAATMATVALQYLRPVLGLPEWSGWTPGWNSVITAAGLAIGAALAGAAAVRVVAARSWRKASDVRIGVALAGAILLGYLAVFSWQEALNWASALVYLFVPLAFIVGARFERLGPPRGRHLVVGTTVLVTGGLVFGVAGGFASRNGPENGYSWTEESHNYSVIAPWWREPGDPNTDIVSQEMGSGTLGIDSLTLSASSPAVLDKFSAFRLEAWRAQAPQDGWALVAGQTAPFASSAASRDGAALAGTIAFNREPNVDWAQIVLTATGPDRHRYLLWAGGPEQTEFFGSVASWFQALMR